MIHIIQGDLLKSDCTVIAHQCNCFSTMGAGIAKQIKNMYPQAYEADKSFPYSPEVRLGKLSYAYIPEKPIIIFNLYGQYDYGRSGVKTNYRALYSAMDSMFYILDEYPVPFPIKIGMPYGIGCGLAGGDWNIVYKMIEKLSVKYNRDVYLYKLK
jgi:O-acetyl-ADP-ribose deacetylase (regulator of RNase III)